MSDTESHQPPRHHGDQHHDAPAIPDAHTPRDDEDDPVARYVEWTEHSLTPHYSRRIRPFEGGGPGTRTLGFLLIAVGLVDVLFVGAVAYGGNTGNGVSGVVLVVLGLGAIVAGLAAFRRRKGV